MARPSQQAPDSMGRIAARTPMFLDTRARFLANSRRRAATPGCWRLERYWKPAAQWLYEVACQRSCERSEWNVCSLGGCSHRGILIRVVLAGRIPKPKALSCSRFGIAGIFSEGRFDYLPRRRNGFLEFRFPRDAARSVLATTSSGDCATAIVLARRRSFHWLTALAKWAAAVFTLRISDRPSAPSVKAANPPPQLDPSASQAGRIPQNAWASAHENRLKR